MGFGWNPPSMGPSASAGSSLIANNVAISSYSGDSIQLSAEAQPSSTSHESQPLSFSLNLASGSPIAQNFEMGSTGVHLNKNK